MMACRNRPRNSRIGLTFQDEPQKKQYQVCGPQVNADVVFACPCIVGVPMITLELSIYLR